MLRFLLFLDRTPVAYWLLVGGFLTLVAALALRSAARGKARSRPGEGMLFWVASALALFVGRFPVVLFRPAFNEDENLFLAQAITALSDPVPWRGFDPMTSGPLNIYALMPPAWFGFRLDYPSARIVGLVEILLGLMALHALARRTFGGFPARVAVVPPLVFFSLTTFNDFVFYSSEHTPAFLLMLGTALAAALGFVGKRALAPTALLAGFILGLAPYAKLQAIPAALAMTAGAYALIFCRRDLGVRWRRRAVVALTAGGVLFSLGLLAVLAVHGGVGDFVTSYLRMQLTYIGRPAPGSVQVLWERVPDFWALFVPAMVFSLLGAGTSGFLRDRVTRAQAILGLALAATLGASLYAVCQPHRPYGHYLLLAVFPAAALAAWAFGAMSGQLRAPEARGRRLALALAFLLGMAGPTVFLRCRTPHLYLGHLPECLQRPPGALVEALAREARPGERVAIWGWLAAAWVHTQARMGTREAEAEFQLLPGPLLGYYRARYLADLERNRPAVFLDAVCPAAAVFRERAEFGFERFPELAELIARDYTLRTEVEGGRIYRLNASLPASPEPVQPAP